MSRDFFLLQVNQLLPNVKEQLNIAKFTSEDLGSNFLCSFITTRTIMFYLLEKQLKGCDPLLRKLSTLKPWCYGQLLMMSSKTGNLKGYMEN